MSRTRLLCAALVGLPLVLTGCSALPSSDADTAAAGSTAASATSADPSAEEAESSTEDTHGRPLEDFDPADAEDVTVDKGQRELPALEVVDEHTFSDGVTVQISDFAPFEPSEDADVPFNPHGNGDPYRIQWTVINGSDDESMRIEEVQVRYDELIPPRVIDPAAGLGIGDQGPLGSGEKATFDEVYLLVDPASTEVSYRNGIEADAETHVFER